MRLTALKASVVACFVVCLPVQSETVTDFQIYMAAEAFQLRKLVEPSRVQMQILDRSDDFETKIVTLNHKQLGAIRLKIKSPVGSGPWPVLFMATGLRAGMHALDVVKSDRQVITVAYDYPVQSGPEVNDMQLAVNVARSALTIQGQMAAALLWLQSQPQVRSDRIVVLNVSFGTFVAPVAQRLAQMMGFQPFATIFAFGGADIQHLVLPHLKSRLSSADFQNVSSPLVQFLSWIDPKQHLPHLRGNFLVIDGRMDKLIPQASAQALYDGLSEPKKRETLQRGHIDQDQDETLAETDRIIQSWLESIGTFL